ncbi:MAG: transporter substrate-binding domain-containing protein [Chloroflexota bacterium]|nr:transporter substrate-binding domain-containing protein [Chloroflexota bacterium]MDE3101526.1 transporter substrate-binding domain-containing protein [Chloroflexota bacterium]
MRVLVRAVAALVVSSMLVTCTPTVAPSPSPSPTPSPIPTAAAVPTFELASYQFAIQTKGKLRVGIRDDDPPFAQKSATGRYEGFDADVARQIAIAIFGTASAADPDAYITWVPVVPATMVSALTDDKADIVASDFEVTDTRMRQIDFSSQYFVTGDRLLVTKASTIASVADIHDRTVCVNKGSSAEKAIPPKAKDAKVLRLDTIDACLDALRQGAADAVWAKETTLFGLVAKDPTTKIVGGYLSSVPCGIGVRKKRVGFVPFINTVIAAMIADGRWPALYKKWISPLSGDLKDGPHDRGRPAA